MTGRGLRPVAGLVRGMTAPGACPVEQIILAGDCMTGQAMRLMLAMQGRGWIARDGRKTAYIDDDGTTVTDPLAILTGIAASEDDRAFRTAAAAFRHLSGMLVATNPRDLDLAAYDVHQVLTALQRATAQRATPDLTDAVLAPVVWRLAVLDRAFGTCCGIGLDSLARRIGLLLARHDGGAILSAQVARRLVAQLRQAGAEIATPGCPEDWSRALGPAGRP